jgi:hypothetical protein
MVYTYLLYTSAKFETLNLSNLENLQYQNKTKEINQSLTDLYIEPGWNRTVNVNIETNDFIYALNQSDSTIVGSVRINKEIKELDYGFILKAHRYNKLTSFDLYQELCNMRVQYIIDNFTDKYVLYTEHDRPSLKDKHIRSGLTLINPSAKSPIPNNFDRRNYWHFEVNRPVSDLFVSLGYNDASICSGLQILDNIIFTAGHCVQNSVLGQKYDDPINIRYPQRSGRSAFTNISKTINLGFEQNKTYLDRAIVVHNEPYVSASNIFILSNPEDLPDGFELICYCQMSCFIRGKNGKKFQVVKKQITGRNYNND